MPDVIELVVGPSDGMIAEASSALSCISAARRSLARAATLDDVLDIRDKAEALRVYIKAAGDSLDAQIAAADIRLRAERKAGEILASMNLVGRSQAATQLSDLGINKSQSSRWQLSAKLPEEQYEAMVASCRESKRELTQAAVLAAARKLDVVDAMQRFESPKLELIELVASVRRTIASFVEQFGNDRVEVLANVLASELMAMDMAAFELLAEMVIECDVKWLNIPLDDSTRNPEVV